MELFHSDQAIADARAEATEYCEIYEDPDLNKAPKDRKIADRQAAMYRAILAGLDLLEVAQSGEVR